MNYSVKSESQNQLSQRKKRRVVIKKTPGLAKYQHKNHFISECI